MTSFILVLGVGWRWVVGRLRIPAALPTGREPREQNSLF